MGILKRIIIFFCGPECVGHSCTYVDHFVFFRDVWIRTHRAAVGSRQTSNLATHLPTNSFLATHFPELSHPTPYTQTLISLLSHLSLYLATHLPTQPCTHLPTQPPISQLSHPSPTQPPISLPTHFQPPISLNLATQLPILRHSSPFLATYLSTQRPISQHSHPSPYLATHLPAQPPISLLSLLWMRITVHFSKNVSYNDLFTILQ